MQYSGYCTQVRHGRDLPADYSDWKNTHRHFCRWRDKGLWEGLLAQVIDVPDFEWIMIDGFHIKAHPHAAGAVGGNQDMSRTKGGLIPFSKNNNTNLVPVFAPSALIKNISRSYGWG